MEILKSNTHVTILFMNLKYNHINNEENYTSFKQNGLQTAEIWMLSSVKT